MRVDERASRWCRKGQVKSLGAKTAQANGHHRGGFKGDTSDDATHLSQLVLPKKPCRRNARLLESIDAGYEDMERLRDLWCSSCSHDLEGQELRYEFLQGLRLLPERADILLKLLERNEAQLKNSLKRLPLQEGCEGG
jgi:hypothetical protein